MIDMIHQHELVIHSASVRAWLRRRRASAHPTGTVQSISSGGCEVPACRPTLYHTHRPSARRCVEMIRRDDSPRSSAEMISVTLSVRQGRAGQWEKALGMWTTMEVEGKHIQTRTIILKTTRLQPDPTP